MNAPPNLSQIEQLRARDGDLCWLCSGKLSFTAPPNSKNAPTREHLEAQSIGGSDKLDNLVLCHPGCNKQLGNRPKAAKLKMRDNHTKVRERRIVAAPTAKPPAQARTAPTLMPKTRSTEPARDRAPLVAAVGYWRRMALGAASVAIFALGLSLGLLLDR